MELQFQKELELQQLFLLSVLIKLYRQLKKMIKAIWRKIIIQFILMKR